MHIQQVFRGETRSPLLKNHALQHFKRWARESESVNKIQAKNDAIRATVASNMERRFTLDDFLRLNELDLVKE